MSQFEATIVGRLDLGAARAAWNSFVSELQKPITIKIDPNSFNFSGASGQRAFKQMAQQMSNTFNATFSHNNGWTLGTGVQNQMASQIQMMKQLGIEVTKVQNTFDKAGKVIGRTYTGRDAFGNLVSINDSLKQTSRQTIDFSRQQAEAAKLAQQVKEVAASYKTLEFDARSSSMTAGLAKYGKYNAQDIQGLQQARDAARDYAAELQKLQTSYNSQTGAFNLPDDEVQKSFAKMTNSVETYNNAMSMVRSNTSMMIKDGSNITAANQVDAWASRNTRALKKYGDELNRISAQMRSTQDAYELKDLQGQYKNIRLQAQAEGLTGNSVWQSLKQSFGKISAFTGIYALTSQIQQVPVKMVSAVRDINEAQIELRKVSSASDTELVDYWDRAADAAKTGKERSNFLPRF